MTDQTPKPDPELLAALRNSLRNRLAADDGPIAALRFEVGSLTEQNTILVSIHDEQKAEIAALRERMEVEEELHLKTLRRAEKAEAALRDTCCDIDPLMGIDGQKWAQQFMRIWSGRWSEVDEGLMISWFANAIMRGFDEGQRRLRKQHGCEFPPIETTDERKDFCENARGVRLVPALRPAPSSPAALRGTDD